MGKPRNDPNALIKFGKQFKNLLVYHGVSNAELARQVNGLTRDIVQQMTVGSNLRLTERNFLRCLKGLVIRKKLTNETQVRDLLQDFYDAREENYVDLKQTPEGQDILMLLAQFETDRKNASLIPKYTTHHGIPLIGREKEIDEIIATLETGIQFYTLVGVPGVGKSELARQIEIAVRERTFFSYVLSIQVEDITSVEDVLRRISENIKDSNSRKRTLIILDDCDKVARIKNASASIYTFLQKHKHLTILATSRVRFSATTSDHREIKPLATPTETTLTPKDLEANEAVHLFIETVIHTSEEAFRLTEQNAGTVVVLCYALGGLPLAILITASWVSKLTLEGVYDRLKDKTKILETGNILSYETGRQENLQELIIWSYDLLGKEGNEGVQLQALLRRLGGLRHDWCSLEEASLVCNFDDLPDYMAENEKAAFLRLVQTLHRYGLIVFSKQRIILAHNTVHLFARSLLEQPKDTLSLSEEAKVRLQWIKHRLLEHLDKLHTYSSAYDPRQWYCLLQEQGQEECTDIIHWFFHDYMPENTASVEGMVLEVGSLIDLEQVAVAIDAKCLDAKIYGITSFIQDPSTQEMYLKVTEYTRKTIIETAEQMNEDVKRSLYSNLSQATKFLATVIFFQHLLRRKQSLEQFFVYYYYREDHKWETWDVYQKNDYSLFIRMLLDSDIDFQKLNDWLGL